MSIESERLDAAPLPPLGPHSRVVIRREGGLAHFPGLAAPRCIRCAECTPEQRRWLADLLERVMQVGAGAGDPLERASGADRRIFLLAIDDEVQQAPVDASASRCTWTRALDENYAPEALVALWRHGTLGEA